MARIKYPNKDMVVTFSYYGCNGVCHLLYLREGVGVVRSREMVVLTTEVVPSTILVDWT